MKSKKGKLPGILRYGDNNVKVAPVQTKGRFPNLKQGKTHFAAIGATEGVWYG